jgi:hypothetical protein
MGACEGTFLPPILQKQCRPSALFKQSTLLLQTINCRKAWANNQQEQSKAPLTVWYEIHTSAQPIQQPHHNLHAYSSVTWSHEIMDNLHAHSSVTWSHDIMDDWHA